jgi:hypothetical protein
VALSAVPLANTAFFINTKRSNTIGLRRALWGSKNGTYRGRVPYIGDSTSEGYGTDAANALAIRDRSPTVIAGRLINEQVCPVKMNNFFGDSTGVSTANVSSYDSRLTNVTNWSTTSSTYSVRGNLFTSASANREFDFAPVDWYGNAQTFDTVETTYLDPAPNAQLLIKRGAATVKTLSSGGSTAQPLKDTTTITANTSVGFKTGPVAGNVFMSGAECYLATETDLQLFDWGWRGSAPADWLSTSSLWSPGNMFAVVGPFDHIFLELGLNAFAIGQSAFETQLGQLADLCLAHATSMTLSTFTQTITSSQTQATQDAFRQSVLNVASARDLSVLDQYNAQGTYVYRNDQGIMLVGSSHNTYYYNKGRILADYVKYVMALGA